jgi:aminoglycoside 3-N-acetyltransferase
MLFCQSKILYVRAGLAPLARQIRASKGVVNFLRQEVEFDEIFVPFFKGARPFWRPSALVGAKPKTHSGGLGRLVAGLPGAVVSSHPTHAFAGLGGRVEQVLRLHTSETSCFWPIKELASTHDFSMLLVGCLDESPGFSTVHAAQNMLGLSQRHLIRYLLRWDVERAGAMQSRVAPEAPGCSESFDKFYSLYKQGNNLQRGQWHGVPWIFVPSAFKALETELSVLREHPRFVKCGKWLCPTCSFRLYR